MMVERDGGASTPLDWVTGGSDIEDLKIASSDIFLDQSEPSPIGDHACHEDRHGILVHEESGMSLNRKRSLEQVEGMRNARVSRRKKKPPGLPKRPLSAYNIFFQQERLKLQEEDTVKISFEEFGKIIGKHWKELTAEKRKEYEELAHKDSIRYRNEMDALKESGKHKKEDIKDKQEDKDISPKPWRASSSLGNALPDLRAAPFSGVPLQGRISDQPPPNFFQGTDLAFRNPPTFRNDDKEQGSLFWGERSPAHTGPVINVPNPSPIDSFARPVSQDTRNAGFPVPPGMEILLPDHNGRERKYTVSYSMYTMSRADAERYLESLTMGSAQTPSLRRHSEVIQKIEEQPRDREHAQNIMQQNHLYPSTGVGSFASSNESRNPYQHYWR